MENALSQQLASHPFMDRVDIELKRAQRYQIFVSLLVYDLSSVSSNNSDNNNSLTHKILKAVGQAVRAIDNVSLLASNKIALLLPETNRQGAEIASKRISSVVQECLESYSSQIDLETVAPEMASYPDAAGMKTIKDFLTDFSSQPN